MSEGKRSELRLRLGPPHLDPGRGDEPVVQVFRQGKRVATIYGTREGVQVVADKPEVHTVHFEMEVSGKPVASVVVPLLLDGETCPWCFDSRVFQGTPCPICRPPE